jgi:hypothetical protein
MNTGLELRMDGDRAAEIHRTGGGLLLRYVYRPDTPADEAPRPYAHPVNTIAGGLLTNFRPNDHRWHHGLSFTISCLAGLNFWGGPTYRASDGYQWQNDHGAQRHIAWLEQGADRLTHTLEWRAASTDKLLLAEKRTLGFAIISPQAWELRWTAVLQNVSGRLLSLGQYQSTQGLEGSHYTGLQFRGARDLLDEHQDEAIGIFAEGGLSGDKAVHGASGRWMEWRGQKDGSQRRVTVRFSNAGDPVHWFVRRHNPLAALAFQYERDLALAPDGVLSIDHALTFADA